MLAEECLVLRSRPTAFAYMPIIFPFCVLAIGANLKQSLSCGLPTVPSLTGVRSGGLGTISIRVMLAGDPNDPTHTRFDSAPHLRYTTSLMHHA